MNLELIRRIDKAHPYPAKFTIDLALKYIEEYSDKGDIVCDPFVGSGTSMLGARITGRRGLGTDINHIAVLISRFKLLTLSRGEINSLWDFIGRIEEKGLLGLEGVTPYSYPSINHWFAPDPILVLSYIRQETGSIEGQGPRLFARLVMSSVVNTLSNQESDTRYAAIEKPFLTREYCLSVFVKRFRYMLENFSEFLSLPMSGTGEVFLKDALLLPELLPPRSAGLILTYPPYVNTYDYYLYHKHRMFWLGYDYNFSMRSEIGSRREFSSLKRPVSKFSSDIAAVFASCDKVLRPGGFAVIVIGDGKVGGRIYDAASDTERICHSLGWSLELCSDSMLDDTSRSFPQGYRTKGKKEHIMVFRKKEG